MAIQVCSELFENELFGQHLKTLRLMGCLCEIGDSTKQHFIKMLLLIFCFTALTILEFAPIYYDGRSVQPLSVSTASVLLSTMVWIVNVIVHRERFFRLMNFVQDNRTEAFGKHNHNDKALIPSCKRAGMFSVYSTLLPTLCLIIFVEMEYFITVFYNPETLFNTNDTPILIHRLFPFREIFPQNLFLSQVMPVIGALLLLTIPGWIHTFMPLFMHYITGRYQLLCDQLENMDISRIRDDSVSRDPDYWHGELCREFIEQQIQLRWLVHEFRKLLRIPAMIDFILFSVIVCYSFYTLVVVKTGPIDMIFSTGYLLNMLNAMIKYYWNASLIRENWEKISYSIYASNWYDFSPKIQKTLLLMMIESKQPIELQAVFIRLNIATFIEILRGGYGYFNILRNLN